jgi:hypothetical protein
VADTANWSTIMRTLSWTAIAASALAIALAAPAAAAPRDYFFGGIVDTVFDPAGLGGVVVGETVIEATVRVDRAFGVDVTDAANAAFGTHYTALEAVPVGPLDSLVFYLVIFPPPPPTVIQYLPHNWITTPDPLGLSGPYVLFNEGRFFGMGFAGVSDTGLGLFLAGAAPYPFDFVGGDVRLGAPSFGGHYVRAAVPEPAAWALMIAGFGLAGAALRRRRAVAAAA